MAVCMRLSREKDMAVCMRSSCEKEDMTKYGGILVRRSRCLGV